LGVEWDKADQQFFLLYAAQKAAYSYKGTLSDANVGNTAKA
jgi:hypothetical protein